MRKKLQNSKDYAESPEFLPALGLFICLSLQLEVNKIPSSLDYKKFTQIYIYIYIHGHQPDYIILLACVRG